MRILLTGLPATGKTTLAGILSERLGLAIVNEAASDLAAEGLDVSPAMGPATLAAIAMEQRTREPAPPTGIVADRGALDMLAYSAVFRTAWSGESVTVTKVIDRFATRWLDEANYNFIIYHGIPCGERGKRLMQREMRMLELLKHEFEALIAQMGARVIKMPALEDPVDRYRFIIKELDI